MRVRAHAIVGVVCVVLALVAAACGGKKVRPATTGPVYPGYEFPAVSGALENAPRDLVDAHQEAWDLLQAGDTRAAARRFSTVTRRAPDFYPSIAGHGYTALAQQDYKQAIEDFDKALAVVSDYVPALLGRADALEATNQIPDAVASLDAVLRVDPSRAEVRTRADSLRFRSIEDLVAQARTALQANKLDEARTAYERALQGSPESAFLYRELAITERRANLLDPAFEHAQHARQLDDRDQPTIILIADIEEARGHFKEAVEAYRQAQILGPRPDLDARITELERRLALAEMPEAFRAIPTASTVTRGDLAALLGARLEAWVARLPPASAELITDVRNHWAQHWILAVSRAGLMEVYPNHTFQPGEIVERADLAGVVSRALSLMAAGNGGSTARLPDARPTFSDLEPTHASYEAAAVAVGSGVLSNGPENAFQPTRPVSGAEAVAAVDRLEAMVGRP
jgi:tetratricopeptide (TPR) repeat protein